MGNPIEDLVWSSESNFVNFVKKKIKNCQASHYFNDVFIEQSFSFGNLGAEEPIKTSQLLISYVLGVSHAKTS